MEDPRTLQPPMGDPDSETDEPQEDFASLFEATEKARDAKIKPDSKIEGTVVSIGEEWIFVDLGAKSEGTISRDELTDEEGRLTVKEGDPVTAYVVNLADGEILLSTKMTAVASEEAVRGAFRSGVPVEGLVLAERKGGYTVKVLGREAFCPYSQMGLRSGGNPDDYLGQRFLFRIAELSERGRNVVLSRRQILEEERLEQIDRLKERLQPGDVVDGVVRNLTKFGAFVDIGGVEGLIPMGELAWHRVNDATEVLHTGQQISVKVMEIDWPNQRISLSLKQTLPDPWSHAAQHYSEGATLAGSVTRLMNFGAFVELEPGIEGLIHISNMGAGRRINHPREVLHEGDRIEVTVLSVDQEARRIGLELNYIGADSNGEPVAELQKGDLVQGTVDSVKEYGVFVALPGARSGLLHVSEIDDGRRGDLKKRFPTGASIEVEILDIDQETKKIALSTRSLLKKAEEARFKDFVSAKNGEKGSLGTLGDLLKDKLKE
ncbi:MAG: 30S ribosomal protein S1 [Deltaproteobacteria bacterium]